MQIWNCRLTATALSPSAGVTDWMFIITIFKTVSL